MVSARAGAPRHACARTARPLAPQFHIIRRAPVSTVAAPFNGRLRPPVDARRRTPRGRILALVNTISPSPRRRPHLQRGRDAAPASSRRSSATRPDRRARRRRRLARRHRRARRSHGRHAAVAARPAPSRQGRPRQRLSRRLRLGARARLSRSIAQLDADLSHPPAILPEMLEALEARRRPRARLALPPGGGSDGWPLHRRLASRIGCAALGARARPALHRSLRRLQALARLRARRRSTSPRRARRATSSRSRRRSARTAPGCASSRCPSRSATAGRRVEDGAVHRARGRAHGRAPAPRRLVASARGVGRRAPARSPRRHGVEALRPLPVPAPRARRRSPPARSAPRATRGEPGVAADQRDRRARHAAEPRDPAQGRAARDRRAARARAPSSRSARPRPRRAASARSELWWLPVRTQT